MKNNDVYMQTRKHSLNKLLRKKADDMYYKKWLKVQKKFNFSRSVIFIFDILPIYVIWLYNKRVWLLLLQRPISHFNIFANQCTAWWGLDKRGRQFYSLRVEGEIGTIFLESKMAFKRLILIKLIIYLLRLIWKGMLQVPIENILRHPFVRTLFIQQNLRNNQNIQKRLTKRWRIQKWVLKTQDSKVHLT